jgi:hypothetical protein
MRDAVFDLATGTITIYQDAVKGKPADTIIELLWRKGEKMLAW